ncbi:hypothetical protein B0H10DRAFT_1298847 [Mycena sp. CBHHK59/15]|nr:hypothetical protein B0H10DRAFT_1298847 [Mycena sp. CBHHK59/15]
MVEQIHAILCAIIGLYWSSAMGGLLPTGILYNIGRFTETLQKIYTLMKSQQETGKIKQLFKYASNVSKLEALKAELQYLLGIFRIQNGNTTMSAMSQMQKDAKQQHEELLALLAAHDSEISSSASMLESLSLGNSSESLSILPSSPQIFHGRKFELQAIVETLSQDSARVVILGTGGMGKTSLALAALHHEAVAAKYPHRFLFRATQHPAAPNFFPLSLRISAWRKAGTSPGKSYVICLTVLHPYWSSTTSRRLGKRPVPAMTSRSFCPSSPMSLIWHFW